MRQGLHLPPGDLRALPPAPSDRAAGLEGLGRCRLSPARRRAEVEVPFRPARRRRVHPDLLGGGLRQDRRRAGGDRPPLQRRGGQAAAAGAGLPARDGRGDGRRRHPHDQDARRHGPARRARQVRHVPAVQLAGPARRQGAGRGARRGAGRPQLVQLHLARRPGPGPPLGARPADLRLRLQRPALLQAHHHGRQEPGREQADRLALVHRVHGAGRQDRGHRARVRPALDQGRLLDPDPARHRRRPLAGHHPPDDRARLVRRGLRSPLHRFSAPGAARQSAPAARPRGLPRLPLGARSGGPVDEDPGPDRRAARATGRLRDLGRGTKDALAPDPRRDRREDGSERHRAGPGGTGVGPRLRSALDRGAAG